MLDNYYEGKGNHITHMTNEEFEKDMIRFISTKAKGTDIIEIINDYITVYDPPIDELAELIKNSHFLMRDLENDLFGIMGLDEDEW